jgi:hypothetical protein
LAPLVGSFQFAGRLNHGKLNEIFSRRRQSLTGHYLSVAASKWPPKS